MTTLDDNYREKPTAGIAKVGQSKWFFVYWPSFKARWDGENDPTLYGYTDSMQEAIEKCGGVETFTYRLDYTKVRRVGRIVERIGWRANIALEWRSIFAMRRRKPNVKATPEVKPTEYVYHHKCCGADSYTCPHRIIKKTAKKIFIEEDCQGRPETEGGVARIPQLALDRAKLDAAGEEGVFVNHGSFRGAGCGDFFTLDAIPPWEKNGKDPDVSDCYQALGVNPSATVAEIKRAYRRQAKQNHPDIGGDAERFRKLREHFEKALALVHA